MESSGTAATTCSWNTQDFVSSRKSTDSGGNTRTCWMSTSTAVATTQLAKVGSMVASVMSFTGADRCEDDSMRNAIAAVLTLSLSLVIPAFAAQDKSAPRNPEQFRERLEELKSRLELTPEQVEQIRPVLREELQKLKAVRDKYNEQGRNRRTRLQMARELRDLRDATDNQLKKILSKKQMQELKKIRQERREQVR